MKTTTKLSVVIAAVLSAVALTAAASPAATDSTKNITVDNQLNGACLKVFDSSGSQLSQINPRQQTSVANMPINQQVTIREYTQDCSKETPGSSGIYPIEFTIKCPAGLKDAPGSVCTLSTEKMGGQDLTLSQDGKTLSVFHID